MLVLIILFVVYIDYMTELRDITTSTNKRTQNEAFFLFMPRQHFIW